MIKILIIKEIEKDSTNKHNCSKHEKGGKKEQKNIMKNNKERLQKYVRNQFRKYVKRIQAKTETIWKKLQECKQNIIVLLMHILMYA